MRWKKEDIELIKSNYFEKGDYNLSKILSCSPNAVRIMASRLGVSRLKQRETVELTDTEEQIVLGSLMGDMYCRIKSSCKNAQLEEGHGRSQDSYLTWKASLLRSLSSGLRRIKSGGLFYESGAYPCLNYYHKLFYGNGRKEINQAILKKLDKLGIAIWYMDDGTYKKRDKASCLHTNGFSYEENLLIKEWFENKWHIFPKIHSVRKPKEYPGRVWHYLSFGVKETPKLFNLIENYIHPSMKYKIGVYT